jgi:hypothetical protein
MNITDKSICSSNTTNTVISISENMNFICEYIGIFFNAAYFAI